MSRNLLPLICILAACGSGSPRLAPTDAASPDDSSSVQEAALDEGEPQGDPSSEVADLPREVGEEVAAEADEVELTVEADDLGQEQVDEEALLEEISEIEELSAKETAEDSPAEPAQELPEEPDVLETPDPQEESETSETSPPCISDDECEDGNPCTDDFCLPEGCVSINNAMPCDDEMECTEEDYCLDGLCSGRPVDCNDDNACTVDLCLPEEGCTHLFNTVSCSDGDACTANDHCSEGDCRGEPVVCNDENSCTDDSCKPSEGCVFFYNHSDCSDGDLCTEDDRCQEGRCGGREVDCQDNNPCTLDLCEPSSGCVHSPTDDGLTLSCGAGNCKHTVPHCHDGEPQSCDPLEGASEEVCGGGDEDCDGETDEEGAEGCETWYQDLDNDGWGAASRCLCGPSAPYTAIAGGDCREDDSSINPGEKESCNGLDDNCAEGIDEEDSLGCLSWYFDKDGDGWGVDELRRCLCSQQGYYTSLKSGDCLDSSVQVNPGVLERCSDVLDNDCDGEVNEGC